MHPGPAGWLRSRWVRRAVLAAVVLAVVGAWFLHPHAATTDSGIGRLVVDAISRRDYPVIQGVTLVFAGVYVLINLLVDIACGLFDPRIRM